MVSPFVEVEYAFALSHTAFRDVFRRETWPTVWATALILLTLIDRTQQVGPKLHAKYRPTKYGSLWTVGGVGGNGNASSMPRPNPWSSLPAKRSLT